MTDFYSPSKTLWFPLMPKKSKDAQPHSGSRRCLNIQYGHRSRFLSPEEAADLAGVSVKTVYKWIAGTHPMDQRTRYLLHSLALGLLPHRNWNGWHIDEAGRLTAHNGWGFHPDELHSLTLLKQLNGSLAADVARLSVENQQLRDALDYLRANTLPTNVVRFPEFSRDETKKKPG